MTEVPFQLTEAFGIDKGKAFDDSTLGNIKSIAKIEIYQGWLVDGMETTYWMADGSKKVANHLGTGKPDHNVTIPFSATEILIGLTGKTGMPGFYGNKPYLNSISFTILDTESGEVRFEGPYGAGAKGRPYHGTVFSIVGEIKSFSGLKLSEKSDPANALTLVFPNSNTQVVSITPYINPSGPIQH